MTAAAANALAQQRKNARDTMGWLLLESLVALLIAVAIVWWTMGPRRKPPHRDGER